MIDSTDADVDRAGAARYCQGKSIINSVNLEDGEERFERVVPLARRYGAALVVGCIDEDKQQGRRSRASASSRSRSARCELLTEKYGIAPRGHHLRPARLPVRHRRRELRRQRGVETIEGIRLIKEALPALQDDPRHLATSPSACRRPGARCSTRSSSTTASQAGLDLAIVNTEKLERYAVDPARRSASSPRTCSGRRGDDPDRRLRRALPRARSRGADGEGARRRCRSTSAWRATSSRARRTASSPTSTEALTDARRRSTSSTAR